MRWIKDTHVRVRYRSTQQMLETKVMFPFVRTLLGLPSSEGDPAVAHTGWDVTSFATVIAIVLIVGFCVVAAGWVIKRDV